MKRALAVVAGAALVMAVPDTASAAPPVRDTTPSTPSRSDDLPSPLSDKQRELRAAGLEKVLRGEVSARGDNKVVQVAKGQYVELAREDTDAIWTVLGEFSDLPHNSIPEPDRSVDNTTIWTDEIGRAHV